MLLKAQDLNLKKKDFFKEKIILLYGENQDLIKDLNEKIINNFLDEKKISLNYLKYLYRIERLLQNHHLQLIDDHNQWLLCQDYLNKLQI